MHGKVFWVGAVAAMGARDVEQLLHALERKQFVRRERRAAIGGEAEYASGTSSCGTSPTRRSRVLSARRSTRRRPSGSSRSAGRTITPSSSFITTRPPSSLVRAAGGETAELTERTRWALREAGDRALALSALGPAAENYARALELWPDDNERPLVLLGLGEAKARAGDAGEDELRRAAAALIEAGLPELAAEAEFLIGSLAWYAGRGEVADEQLTRALALVEPLPDSRSKAWTLSEASRMAMLSSRYDESLEYGRRALDLAATLELPEVRVHALASVGVVHAERGDRQGIADLEESAALARDLNSPEVVRALFNLSSVYDAYGQVLASRETRGAAVAGSRAVWAQGHGIERPGRFAGGALPRGSVG